MNRFALSLALALVALALAGCSSQKASEGSGGYSTKSSQGDIAFDLTPHFQGDDKLIVDVRANTHSGDLADLDLASLLTLHANDTTYRPTDATALDGHHAAAEVTFAVDSKPEQFALTLGAVRNVGEQRFEWP